MKNSVSIFVLFLAFHSNPASSLEGNSFLHRNGTFPIGGLFPVHDYAPNTDFNSCGQLNTFKTLLAEAHLFATDYVNNNLLANKQFTIGAFLADSCNSYSIGLKNSVPFIKNMTAGFCHKYSDRKMVDHDTIYAVGGAFESGVGQNINFLLEGYCIPLVGAVSTSPLFDNEHMFPYFLRTAASDLFQARALYDLLLKMKWKKISIIYENSVYGYYLMKEIDSLIGIRTYKSPANFVNDCGKVLELGIYNGQPEWGKIKDHLQSNDTPPVVLVLLNYPSARDFFLKIKEWGMEGKFQFVGSDGWSSQVNYTGIESALNNSLTTQTFYSNFEAFHEHLNSTTLSSARATNHWLAELIELQSGCGKLPSKCTGKERLKQPIDIGALKRARKVFQVVYSIGDALLRLQERFCLGRNDICTNFYTHFTGELFYKEIKSTNYSTDIDSFHFFNRSNSGAPTYSIMQFQADKDPKWALVGQYNIVNETEEIFDVCCPSSSSCCLNCTKMLEPHLWDRIDSYMHNCSGECGGARQVTEDHSGCCQKCKKCALFQYITWRVNQSTIKYCQDCPEDSDDLQPNPLDGFATCVKPKPKYFVMSPNLDAGFVLSFCGVGVLACVFCGIVLLRHFKTPMARASLTEVLIALDISLALLFASTVFMLPTSSRIFCTVGWFVPSVILALCHALALLKALRLGRPSWYLKIRKQRPCPRAGWSKCFVTSAVLLQLLVALIWAVLRTPRIEIVKDKDKSNYKLGEQFIFKCSANDEPASLIVLALPILYLLASFPLLRRALQNPFMFLVWQTRFIVAGWLCLVINYAVMLLVYFIQDPKNVEFKAVLMMCVPLITGYVFLLSMLAPAVYAFTSKKNQNLEAFVKRKRAQLFEQGNVIYMVTPVVRPSLRKIIKRFSNRLSGENEENENRERTRSVNLEVPDDDLTRL